jgi:hypothetical protein
MKIWAARFHCGRLDGFMIEKKIEEARTLYDRWACALSSRKNIVGSIEGYRNAIALNSEQMAGAGVVRACSSCAAGPGGSCCFHGVEDWYDDVLLLINLLLGVPLPDNREVFDGCYFVGEKGCRLLARHAFCVNYLCPFLSESLEADERAKLIAGSGYELLCGWELEKSLRRLFKL